ncbi:hypothetical protein CNY89_19855, partial [Amaricoccus sp. HAR-UPW-R2A-40]
MRVAKLDEDQSADAAAWPKVLAASAAKMAAGRSVRPRQQAIHLLALRFAAARAKLRLPCDPVRANCARAHG